MDTKELINKVNRIKKMDNLYVEIINGRNLMHILAVRGQIDIIDRTIKRFPEYNVNITDNDGNTLIHLLLLGGFYDKPFITRHINSLNKMNRKGESIIYLMVKYTKNDKDIIYMVEKAVAIDKYTLIRTSTGKGRSVLVELFVKSKESKSIMEYVKNVFNDTIDINQPTHITQIFNILDAKNIKLFNYLIESGKFTNINTINEYGIPLMSKLIILNELKSVQLVIKHLKSSLNIDISGYAGSYNPMNTTLIKRNHDMMRLVMTMKPNINIKDKYHNTILHNFIMVFRIDSKGEPNIPFDIMGYLMKTGDMTFKNYGGVSPIDIIKKRKLVDLLRLITNNDIPMTFSSDDIHAMSCSDDNVLCKELISVPYKISIDEESNKSIHDTTNGKSNKGLFNSDTLHNMIYTYNLLKTYDNLTIPYQSSSQERKETHDWMMKMWYNDTSDEQIQLWSITSIYSGAFNNFLPHIIIWRNIDNYYIHKDFGMYLRMAKARTKRFILIKLTLLPSSDMAHANSLIYDKKLNKVTRFEPYGVDSINNDPVLDSELKNIFVKSLCDDTLTYVKPSDYLTNFKWQTMSDEDNNRMIALGDPEGYCLAWCFWFITLKLSNPDIDEKELMTIKFKSIKNYDSDSGNKYMIHIRSFADKMVNSKNLFLKKVGIPEMAYYKIFLSPKYNSIVRNNVNKELRQLLNK